MNNTDTIIVTITGTKTRNLKNFIVFGGGGFDGDRFSCSYHFGSLVGEGDFGVASIRWLLAERRENLMEVGGRLRHGSNRGE